MLISTRLDYQAPEFSIFSFRKPIEQDLRVKYKTEICKNWLNSQCHFGDNCMFAHGKEELRKKFIQMPQQCKSFSETGFCVYGDRCQFKHVPALKQRLPIFIAICKKGKLEEKLAPK
ncbi:unnamed protein product [Blepharisma stoltei]|uniref:C3H1-type domain-containing protein n=1 Tax=Blepharisma stoltei TaxID=1481888 RepID=A0AAU9IVX7_9CILI|nr:unnamed protein product [Blepharisma stoltei]